MNKTRSKWQSMVRSGAATILLGALGLFAFLWIALTLLEHFSHHPGKPGSARVSHGSVHDPDALADHRKGAIYRF